MYSTISAYSTYLAHVSMYSPSYVQHLLALLKRTPFKHFEKDVNRGSKLEPRAIQLQERSSVTNRRWMYPWKY